MRHPNKIVILFLPLLFLLISCQKEPTQKTATEPTGVTDSEILIGSSCPLTGHASFLGTNYIHGAQSYINYINVKGGIFGRKIRVIAYDDGYDPPRA